MLSFLLLRRVPRAFVPQVRLEPASPTMPAYTYKIRKSGQKTYRPELRVLYLLTPLNLELLLAAALPADLSPSFPPPLTVVIPDTAGGSLFRLFTLLIATGGETRGAASQYRIPPADPPPPPLMSSSFTKLEQ